MNRMMNSFFGAPQMGFGMGLMGPGPQMGHQHHGGHEHDEMMPFGGGMMSPFGAFGGFPDMSRMMTMANPGNAGHAFSSSSFVSFSAGPDGRPQVYQASSETRQGPGGIKETRKTLADSRSGTKKMAVGRHMGERGHVVEREQNTRTGQLNENHEFYNLEEEEAPHFDREWRHRAHGQGRYAHSASMPAITAASAPAVAEIEYVEHPEDYEVPGHSSAGYQPRHTESSVTIEELPASDDEAEQSRARRSYPQATPAPAAASASSSRRSPYGATKEKRHKRAKPGRKY